jgi:HlyD family secretion protein
MAENPLFRKAALDKAASPERLDVLMQVTSPKGWLALWTTAGLLLGVIVWSIFYQVPTRVDGEGILIQGGALREIRTSGEGSVISLSAAVNDRVETGQVIAEIAQQGMGEKENDAFQRYQEALGEEGLARAEAGATIAGYRQTIANNEGEIATTEAQSGTVNADLDRLRGLLERGLVTEQRVQQVEVQALQLTTRINTLKASISNQQAAIRSEQAKVRQRESRTQETERQWNEVRNVNLERSQVTSAVSGRVVELNTQVGDRVRDGDVLAIVEPDGDMEPVAYIIATQGKQILPDMPAQIAPSTVKREEFGFMRGTVRTVGEFPVTLQYLQSVVRNDALAQELYGNSSKVEVRLDLSAVADDRNVSGYEWSSSNGPPYEVTSGTPVTVSVEVERKPPIFWVMPFLRGRLGPS